MFHPLVCVAKPVTGETLIALKQEVTWWCVFDCAQSFLLPWPQCHYSVSLSPSPVCVSLFCGCMLACVCACEHAPEKNVTFKAHVLILALHFMLSLETAYSILLLFSNGVK